MSDEYSQTYPSPKEMSSKAHLASFDDYETMYNLSLNTPVEFWRRVLDKANFMFEKPYDVKNFVSYNFDTRKGRIFVEWMPGSSTNLCYNCLDRNVEKGLGDKVAFYWEGNQPDDDSKITYRELLDEVCKFANVLRRLGVRRGHRVVIYLPMILELSVVMLACARIGAVHSIVFGGFSAEALASRVIDAGADIIVTANGVFRGKTLLKLKNIVDDAINLCRQK
uniref:acetate--CoA ligase n=1 Tax=Romanomermis culicivorax TaxID=13658 RepID=A0A915J049_ROMCU